MQNAMFPTSIEMISINNIIYFEDLPFIVFDGDVVKKAT